MSFTLRFSFFSFIIIWTLASCGDTQTTTEDGPIDRQALVSRHNVHFTTFDTLDALSVGNGEFAITVDPTGFQSFPALYEHGMNLGTQTQWAWHSIPNPADYRYEEVLKDYESCNDKIVNYATQHKSGRAKEVTDWYRANPHRLHLGLIGLDMTDSSGKSVSIEDISDIDQTINLWTGIISSTFKIDGTEVKVKTAAHPNNDEVGFEIESKLLATGQIKVKFDFPYGKECHVCPGYDFQSDDRHLSDIIEQDADHVLIHRKLDDDGYQVRVAWTGGAKWQEIAQHEYHLVPQSGSNTLSLSVAYSPTDLSINNHSTKEIIAANEIQWPTFWQKGAAIDLSGSTDPRAHELERRIILSQYLTKIQCSGSLPPQETGLTFNSWYGKFHLEMHWWHGVHFALWDRIDLLEHSMQWYDDILPAARAIAQRQGYEGVRWPKMTDPKGISSPSSVGEFLIWQQPHPIYFAELFYRQDSSRETLERYQDIVIETADFMASFAQWNEEELRYHLCHPIIPAQEIFHATETDDPPFEVAYWHYGLSVAQRWRERLGMDMDPDWQHVIDHLAALPQYEDRYLPAARATAAYTDDDNRRDHPIVTGAYGMLPGTPATDPEIMSATLEDIMEKWNWQTTWGWDYPMLAMCAARLGKPDMAVDALLMDVQKNTYLPNGHNYQDQRLRIYLPGNGGLLTAVAMMAAGWDGNDKTHPGFPNDGSWSIKTEGFKIMP